MSLNIYSKESVDSLLNAKIGDAPSDGNQYVRKNAAWAILSGGGGGGVWGTITGSITDQTDLISYFGNYLPLTGGTLSGPVYSNSIFSTSYLSTYTTVAPSGLTAYDGTNTTIVQGSGVVFTDSSVQTTAATVFNGGSISNPLTIDSATYPQLYITDSTHTVNPQIVITDGTNGTVLSPAGLDAAGGISVAYGAISFPDGSSQSTAGVPLNGSLAMTGSLTLGGDLACDGYNLSGGNFSSPAGQVNCQNLTLTNGDSGSVTFSDGSIQTTASFGLDATATCNAGITSALAISLVSFDGNNTWTFNFGSGAFANNVLNNVAVTQDSGSTFYAFDNYLGSGQFQASSFSNNSLNYIYLCFKDGSGNWHINTSAEVYSP